MWLQLIFLVGGSAVLALAYAFVSYNKVIQFTVDNTRVNELSEIIQNGAMAFLSREYKWLAPFVVLVTGLLWYKIGMPTAISFLLGALASGLAGFVGMKVATKSNGKTAFAATRGVN
ncbi:MAG: sodium/proton-translocating pyrophosphatase, partial [Synergistales bacterium]|nr:sodium/proton-translocating pyrophosphatase [Synergistales bacterium]